MQVVSDIPSLLSLVDARMKDKEVRLISLDGWTGCGKSTIVAPKIVEMFGCKHVEGDSVFLVPKQGTHEINIAVASNELKADGFVLADSILMNDILAKVGISANISIYVKVINDVGEWIYQHVVDEKSDLCKLMFHYTSPLDQQLIKYHRAYRPDINSDIVLLNSDPLYSKFSTVPEMFYP